mgnify:CR=1 FL=1
MQNLIKAVETEQKKRLEDFIFSINQIESTDTFDCKGLDTWQYRELLPKGKDVSNFTFNALKGYLISRKEKAIYKAIEREVSKVKAVYGAGTLLEVKITVEWKSSRMWGSNPTAECWYSYTNARGNYDSNYIKTGSIGGCGYDKLSTAVAECLNQVNEVLKPMYEIKNESLAINPNIKNHDIFGYGSGYWIFPSIEGGVGVSCYPAIFDKLGFDFKTTASGKTFDVFTITKKVA